jgi:hypothetical protein
VRWRIHPPDTDGITRVSLTGAVTVEEAFDVLGALEQELVAHRPRALLFETNGFSLDEIRTAETQKIAAAWRWAGILREVPLAYVQADPVLYGVIRQVVAWRDAENASVFRHEDDALAWLRKQLRG